MDLGTYSSYLEVNLDALRDNIKKVEGYVAGRAAMLPVIKANAYAMGLVPVAGVLAKELGYDRLAVAQVWEGETLRKAGFDSQRILIMGSAPAHAISAAVALDLDITVFLADAVRAIDAAAREAGKTARVHIKLDTGMNRIGVKVGEELDRLLAVVKGCNHLSVAGVFTHFATSANRQDANTLAQYALFKQGVGQVRAAGLEPEMIHCCNSGATVWLEDALDFCTHYRPGSVMMGYDMMEDLSNPLGVREPMSWRAFLTNIHTVYPGEGVGYGRHFEPAEPTVVGTVSIGYGDGLFRPMVQSGGPVLVRDTRSRYLACCMDQCFVDVTGIDCRVGDEITVVGYSRGGTLLSAFEIERYTGQCYQNALCSINDRVKRVYVPDGL